MYVCAFANSAEGLGNWCSVTLEIHYYTLFRGLDRSVFLVQDVSVVETIRILEELSQFSC